MDNNGLYFSVKGTLQDEQVSLDNLSLPIISEFVEYVSKFIKGDEKIDLGSLRVAVKPGSFALTVPPETAIISAVSDYRIVKNTGRLDGINPVRARVLADLQEKARKNADLVYTITDSSDGPNANRTSIIISSDSDYKTTIEDQWIQTEAYLYGKVYDLGGKNKSNVHIELENGGTIKLDATTELLAEDTESRVYKNQLVRVRAERNLRTGNLRNEHLVSFENYSPRHDEDEFQKIVAQTREAWSDVPDIVVWVQELRGVYA